MPYLINKKANINERNAFYTKCTKDGAVYVVCTTKIKYARVEFDAYTLDNAVRKHLLTDQDDLKLIGERLYEDFGRPKTRQRGLGFIISFEELEIDTAIAITIELTKRLEKYVEEVREKLTVG